jgi:hypothetical protein
MLDAALISTSPSESVAAKGAAKRQVAERAKKTVDNNLFMGLVMLHKLPVVTTKKSGEGQIFVNVGPVQAILVNLNIVQLFCRCAFKPPVASDGK